MDRILKRAGHEAPKQKRILEINGSHDLVKGLQERFDRDKTDPVIRDLAQLLYGYAMLADGAEINDPGPFNQALEGIMVRAVEDSGPRVS